MSRSLKLAYAALMLGLIAAAIGLGDARLLPLPAVAAAGYGMLLARGVKRFHWADLATSIRLLSAAVAAFLAAFAPGALGGWAIVAVLAAGEVTDWLDGHLSRRYGGSPFGAALDEETDAVFILSAALVLTVVHDLPARVVTAGILRYAAVLPFALLGTAPVFPRVFSRVSKTACALAATLLVTATAPFWGRAVAVTLGDLAVALLCLSFGWEALIRLRHAPGLARMWGLARSLLIYYAIPGTRRRTSRLYGRFVPHGGLAFDIGAHVGSRIAALRRNHVRVVAVEPDPGLVRLLRRLYGGDPGVTVVQAAVAEREGRATLRRSRAHPTLSSIQNDWIEKVSRNVLFRGIAWEEALEVEVLTLDQLIARYGRPDFCKIDVEGGEAAVLAGLTQPIPALSFEYLPASIDVALRCVARLAELGAYRFNASKVETMRLSFPDWMDARGLVTWLESFPLTGRSGDVYARLEA